jgi:calcineurin-like phosphoesterase family protein
MKISRNSNIWFTSDTHYSHRNLVAGTTRWRDENGEIPMDAVRNFVSIEEMNTAMINGINGYVGSNDILFHLGDWSFGGIEKVKEFREKINCNNIIFIQGNHDHHIKQDLDGTIRPMFSSVHDYLEVEIDPTKEKLILFHYPIESWNGIREGSIMLHGHCHFKGKRRFGLGKRMDVGMCGSIEIGFRPYHLDEILHIMNQRK